MRLPLQLTLGSRFCSPPLAELHLRQSEDWSRCISVGAIKVDVSFPWMQQIRTERNLTAKHVLCLLWT